jgi:hypothetical protein
VDLVAILLIAESGRIIKRALCAAWTMIQYDHVTKETEVLFSMDFHLTMRLGLLLVSLMLVSCSGAGTAGFGRNHEKGVKGDAMTVTDEMFRDVETGVLGPTPCSPKKPADPSFRGILINAPKRVSFKKGFPGEGLGTFTTIPICGYYILDVPYPPKHESMLGALRLVAVNKDTGKKYTGPVIDRSDGVPPPKTPPFTEEQLRGVYVGGYFNPNLVEPVRLPEAPAVYDVHVELGNRGEGGFVESNTVTIEIHEEGGK